MARTALSEFCRQSSTNDVNCLAQPAEIIVSDGDIAGEILRLASEKSCDLIVLGASKGILSGTSVGNTIKTILKNSKIPTLVIPSGEQ